MTIEIGGLLEEVDKDIFELLSSGLIDLTNLVSVYDTIDELTHKFCNSAYRVKVYPHFNLAEKPIIIVVECRLFADIVNGEY